jgi:hypothetical protein
VPERRRVGVRRGHPAELPLTTMAPPSGEARARSLTGWSCE